MERRPPLSCPARSRALAGAPPRQRGLTLVETLVAGALLVLVLGALIMVFTGSRRMDRTTQLTASMLGALLVKEQIALDLRQIGVRPGPAGPVAIGPSSLCFYRASFEGPRIALSPVRYSTARTPGGNLHLVREEFRSGVVRRRTVMRDVVLRTIRFQELVDRRGPGRYVLVTLVTLPEDLPDSQVDDRSKGRTFSLRFLTECTVPALLGARLLSDTAQLVADGDLPQPL